MRLLVMEDDRTLRGVVVRRLRKVGFAVDEVGALTEAESALRFHDYDCLVLDRVMPDGDALDLVQRQRTKGTTTPVLFLSARDSLPERVAGFEAGADDYVTKPFELSELEVRVQALCRRKVRPRPTLERCGDLEVDRAARVVRRGGAVLSLTPKEYALLEALIDRMGTVVSRSELTERCWDHRAHVMSNSVNVHMGSLRRKLGAPPLIRTVRGGGYMLHAGEDA